MDMSDSPEWASQQKSSVGLFSAEEREGDSSWTGDQGLKHLSSEHKCVPNQSGIFTFFFAQLALTFTLAANETKRRRVMRVRVLIRGFRRKLIS